MDIEVFRAYCPYCKYHLLLVLDWGWSLICEKCGYVEFLAEVLDDNLRILPEKAGKD